MSELIDRVAQAIVAPIYEAAGETRIPSWSKLGEATRDYYRAVARAAIEAMVEPTETMLMAGYEASEGAVSVWKWMIEEGLNGGPPK